MGMDDYDRLTNSIHHSLYSSTKKQCHAGGFGPDHQARLLPQRLSHHGRLIDPPALSGGRVLPPPESRRERNPYKHCHIDEDEDNEEKGRGGRRLKDGGGRCLGEQNGKEERRVDVL